MTHTIEISQETKNKLRDAVLKKLFVLPAFRLNKKQSEVIKNYAISQFNKNLSQIQINEKENSYIFQNNLKLVKQCATYTSDLSEFKKFFNQLKTTMVMMSEKAWRHFLITILSFLFCYFIFRQDNLQIKLVGIVLLFVFYLYSFKFFIETLILNLLVKNTFNYLYQTIGEIQFYVNNINLLKNQKESIFIKNLENFANKIVKEFIYEEIRQIDYQSKKIHFFPLIFAFLMSFIVIYITGDQFVIIIKKVAEYINLINFFPTINNLNIQTFWLFFLFSISMAWARDLTVEISKRYSKKLHQSLFFIENSEEV